MQSRGFHQRCVESHVGPLESSRFESAILGSGHTFSTTNEFRDAIYLMSVGGHFRYKFKMNCLKHMIVICVVEGCHWKATTRVVGRITKIVQVHTFRNKHNHSLEDVSISEPTVRCNRATAMIDDVIRSNPDYLPRQICKDFRRQYGMQLNYCQEWNLKENAKERIHGVSQCSYKLLPWLCTRIIETNPGTVAEYRCSDDARELRGLALVLEKLKMVIGERDVIIISDRHQGIICSVSRYLILYGEWGLMYLIMLMTGISTIYGTVRDALGHTYPFLNPPTTKRPPGRPRKRRIESQFM
ncbi:hypothetical protein AAG906_011273 [Vitis piasezkii]